MTAFSWERWRPAGETPADICSPKKSEDEGRHIFV